MILTNFNKKHKKSKNVEELDFEKLRSEIIKPKKKNFNNRRRRK